MTVVVVVVVGRQVGWGVAGRGIGRERRAQFAGPTPGVHNMSVIKKEGKSMERRKEGKKRSERVGPFCKASLASILACSIAETRKPSRVYTKNTLPLLYIHTIYI